MADQSKSAWLVFVLIAAGVVIFLLGFWHNKAQNEPGVVLGNILPASSSAPEAAPLAAPAVHPATAMKADVVPPMSIIDNSADHYESAYAIQVYSFQDKNRAQKALTALQNSGYKGAYIIVSDLSDKGTWYRVRIGGIPDQTAARTMLEEIRKNYNSGFIVKPKKH